MDAKAVVQPQDQRALLQSDGPAFPPGQRGPSAMAGNGAADVKGLAIAVLDVAGQARSEGGIRHAEGQGHAKLGPRACEFAPDHPRANGGHSIARLARGVPGLRRVEEGQVGHTGRSRGDRPHRRVGSTGEGDPHARATQVKHMAAQGRGKAVDPDGDRCRVGHGTCPERLTPLED